MNPLLVLPTSPFTSPAAPPHVHTPREYTDPWGARLTLTKDRGHIILRIIEPLRRASIRIPDHMTILITKNMGEATGLTREELDALAHGRKARFNTHARATQAGEHTGDWVADNGTVLRIYPDQGNHVLLELETENVGVSINLSPADVPRLTWDMRRTTGKTDEQLLHEGLLHGVYNTRPPETEAEKTRHDFLLRTNPTYARLMRTIEAKQAPGAAFTKKGENHES